MDGNRFDKVARAMASGSSRRSVLRGLLGLGGAAIGGAAVSVSVDARTAGTRPTIPPPPPATTTTSTTAAPTTTTPDPCTGFKCGLECCATELQCCDGECCPAGSSCLTRLFPEDPNVEEETCCRSDLVCGADPGKCCADGQECCADSGCCDGRCYVHDFLEQELCCSNEAFCQVTEECCDSGWLCCADEGCCQGPCYVDISGSEFCCPAAFATVCGTECCANGTHKCCTRDGVSTCIPLDACCLPSECQTPENQCLQAACPVGTGICGSEPKPDNTSCSDGDVCTLSDHCEDGECVSTEFQICPQTNECFTAGTCQSATGCSPETYRGEGAECSVGTCVESECCDPSCGSRVCGPDACGGSCGTCGEGTVCSSDGLACTNLNPSPQCAGFDYCGTFGPCDDGDGACLHIIEGGSHCAPNFTPIFFGAACDSTSDCPATYICANMGCTLVPPQPGYFCVNAPLAG